MGPFKKYFSLEGMGDTPYKSSVFPIEKVNKGGGGGVKINWVNIVPCLSLIPLILQYNSNLNSYANECVY